MIRDQDQNFVGLEKNNFFFNIDVDTAPVLICGDPLKKLLAMIQIYPEVKVLEHQKDLRPNFEKVGKYGFKFWLTPTDKSKKRLCVISCD